MSSERSPSRLAVLSASIAVLLLSQGATAQPLGGSGIMGRGMMGAGMGPRMMGGGGADRPVTPGWGGRVLDHDQAETFIRRGADKGAVDAKNDTITYRGSDVTIDMVAVQPGHEDQTFEVDGLTNPTLIVPRGATVHLNLLNMDYGDAMEHGVILTRDPPPYPGMAMMATGPGFAAVMPLLPWRSSKDLSKAKFAAVGTTFFADRAGTYWYVCPTPGHAEEGMYGKFVIE
ncbi:sulfocyanin-like copper-binding protein [Jiella sp. M17.18]|uniref:sulfocyanin-like copper-binding protein n=1 Tax=Jiella sp. M17.18 TaxID=3234247 RepID=UPI0034E041AA